MIRKFMYSLCIFFIFISNITTADEIHQQSIIKINNIKMFENAAYKILVRQVVEV